MATLIDQLFEIIEPSLSSMGFQLWGIEKIDGTQPILRIYIDSEQGVTLDECVTASRQISLLLDVQDIIPSRYHLEVSSPGMARRLFYPSQYPQYVNHAIEVHLKNLVGNRRKLAGVLKEVHDTTFSLNVEADVVNIDFMNVAKAKVIPDYVGGDQDK